MGRWEDWLIEESYPVSQSAKELIRGLVPWMLSVKWELRRAVGVTPQISNRAID